MTRRARKRIERRKRAMAEHRLVARRVKNRLLGKSRSRFRNIILNGKRYATIDAAVAAVRVGSDDVVYVV